MYSALESAVKSKNIEKVRESLLMHTKQILFIAARTDNHEIIELLINSLNFEDTEKKLLIAIFQGDVKSAELASRHIVSLHGRVELHEILEEVYHSILRKNTRKQMLQVLMKYGLDTNIRNHREQNLLLEFIFYLKKGDHDAVEVAEILINSGVSIDTGLTPLIASISIKHIPLISFFIKKGAVMYENNRLAIIEAAHTNNEEIINLVLSAGADINTKDRFGNTALHFAVDFGNEEVISLLIHKGANVNVKNLDNVTPFYRLFSSINFKNDSYDKGMKVMVKEFSRLTFENRPVSKIDMDLLNENPKAQRYFEKCMIELEQMKGTKFFASYSYHSILQMSKNIKKLAILTKNDKLLTKFETNLESFPCYANELHRILEEAIKFRDNSRIIESRLNSIFGDFLPSVVKSELAKNLDVEDLPLE